MDLSPYDFDLPESLIALRPVYPREAARLLIVHGGGRLEDAYMRDLPELLQSSDRLVFNDTRVLLAALQAVRPARNMQGQDISVHINLVTKAGPDRWRALARPGKRLKTGDVLLLPDALRAKIIDKATNGEIELEFNLTGAELQAAIEQYGAMPLPPYIARQRPADVQDKIDYQTRFAGAEAASVAAPTAGLHFSELLLSALTAKGIGQDYVRLDVGQGTFAPLTTKDWQSHRLHAEWRIIEAETANRLNKHRAKGARIIPVGTTAMRTLESAVGDTGHLMPVSGPTDIFIRPGDPVQITQGLVTNFHLPKSSLFMLVSALMGTGLMQAAYAHAIAHKYRFYSYGDACLLLP